MTKSQEEEEEVVKQDQDISGNVPGHMSGGLGKPREVPRKSGEVLVYYFGQLSSPFDPCFVSLGGNCALYTYF